jgi:phosphatidylglycerophosphate synthase
VFSQAKAIYFATRKRNDQLFNTYLMRPLAAGVVSLVARTGVTPNQLTILSVVLFAAAAAVFVAVPSPLGALLGVAIVELSYLFDCVDGMLARHKKIASREGHLFDFFTDEIKAVLLVGTLAIRFWRTGGLALTGESWPAGEPAFLLAGIAGVAALASATSLTNFVRRPEISGQETPIEAHYETVQKSEQSAAAKVGGGVVTFLRFLNHYPSHIWLFAAFGALDLFFWIYVGINLLYLGRGWLGLIWRFGR